MRPPNHFPVIDLITRSSEGAEGGGGGREYTLLAFLCGKAIIGREEPGVLGGVAGFDAENQAVETDIFGGT